MIYCETNYEHGTRVEVDGPLNGLVYVRFIDVDSGSLIGNRRYAQSAECRAVRYAKTLIAGEVQKGDYVTI